jgi:hypothetical protein
VILLGIYRGEIHAHRPPGLMVKLDKPIGHYKVVMAAPADVRVDPKAPPRVPPPAKPKNTPKRTKP